MIESLHNDKIKNLVRLATDNRYRKKTNMFMVEGKQENFFAQKNNFSPLEFFICETIFNDEIPSLGRVHFVSEKVYQKIAYRGTAEGIVGIYEVKYSALTEYSPSENANIIVVEGAEKPGNIGAILRSCEAFGIEALLICDAKTDLYNPNVIRSSVGCLFGMKVYQCSNDEAFAFFQKNKIRLYTTYMSKEFKSIFDVSFKQNKTALLFGTEHSGISSFWNDVAVNVHIPTIGKVDSLNLSNAVAIACYEMLRQNN